jgi:hypothetical protein
MKSSRPDIFFWRQNKEIGNFGDSLTLLYEKYMVDHYHDDHPTSLHLVGSVITENHIGKIMHHAKRHDRPPRAVFWGCGKKNGDPLSPQQQAICTFHGVRGLLSRDALQLPRTTPLGDTALLLPRFYQPAPDMVTSGKTVWVPHFNNPDPSPEEMDRSPDPILVRPAMPNDAASVERLVGAIASARFVMANAMHAAIVALAYGVPFAFWDGAKIDHPFKWADFASGVGFDLPFVQTQAQGLAAYDRARPDRAYAEMDLAPLLAVAPFAVRG